MVAETVTRTLHRLTSYEQGRNWDVPADDARLLRFTTSEMDRVPRQYKRYDLPRRSLPREWPSGRMPAVAALAGSSLSPPVMPDLTAVARMFFLSAGVTRTKEWRGRSFLFRASGSAGGRFPIELYLAVPEGSALPSGVHWYDPLQHALVEIGAPPVGGAPTVVVTGLPWRTGWRYAERGYRHVYWDAGSMLAQLLALADSDGVRARLFTRFPDSAVGELVGADGVHEWPVAVVALGAGEPALSPSGPAVAGETDTDALEFPLVTAAQRAGDVVSLGAEFGRGAPVEVEATEGDPLDDVALRRGSARLLDPGRGIPRSWLADAMATAMRGISVPHWVAVNAVDGLVAGVYAWPDLDKPVRPGSPRLELYYASDEQGLPRDASFVVIGAINLTRIDDRAYREAQLSAGLVEGRLHLMAYALGCAASGMTFQDDLIPDLVGCDVSGLLWTCVGIPEYRSRRGGPPGRPTLIAASIEPREYDGA
jgi:hypothetical protein